MRALQYRSKPGRYYGNADGQPSFSASRAKWLFDTGNIRQQPLPSRFDRNFRTDKLLCLFRQRYGHEDRLVPAMLITVRLMGPSDGASYSGRYLEANPGRSTLSL